MQNRDREVKKTLLLVLVLNWLVAALKIAFGLFTRCASITADGFHSLSDGTSNIIGLFGMRLASQPKDTDHPYGHKKYETFFSILIAMLLFFVAFNLFREGIKRIYHPVEPQVDARSFLIMIATLLVNVAVMNYERNKGKTLLSDILVSDAMHTRADILTSIAVIIALVVIKLGYPILDPIATMLISFFIAYAGLGILKDSSKVLCDTAPIADLKKISDIVLDVKGVKACHKIRTRGRPDDINVDLHVQVAPNMHIDQAHKVSYAIEAAIKAMIPEVTDVIVHIEPQEK